MDLTGSYGGDPRLPLLPLDREREQLISMAISKKVLLDE